MSTLALTSNTLAVTAGAGQIEYNGQFFATDSNASRGQVERITQGTAVASTSGTSIDFTGIPAWAKKITVMFNGVSTSSTSNLQIQIGSGSIATTGYVAQATAAGTGVGTVNSTTGFILTQSTASTDATSGNIQIVLQTGSSYISTGILNKAGATALCFNAGLINLAGTLDRVRITTVNGTDTFDAGSINIMYEG